MIKGMYQGVFGCCGAAQISGLQSVTPQYLKDVIEMWKNPTGLPQNKVDYDPTRNALIPESRTNGTPPNPYIPQVVYQIVTPAPHPSQTFFAVTAGMQKTLWPDLEESGFIKVLTFDSNHGGVGNRGLVLWAKPRQGQGNISVGIEAMKTKAVVVANQEDFEKKFAVQEANIRALQAAQQQVAAARDAALTAQRNAEVVRDRYLRIFQQAAPRSKNLRDILTAEGIRL